MGSDPLRIQEYYFQIDLNSVQIGLNLWIDLDF